MSILEFSNLKYSYDGKQGVLKGISGQMELGKMYAILGPSGCGKTTLLSLCIFRPSESKETVGVSPPSREKQVQVHGRESTGVLFGKKWQRNASQSAPPRVIYSDWNPFLLRMESSPSMRIL